MVPWLVKLPVHKTFGFPQQPAGKVFSTQTSCSCLVTKRTSTATFPVGTPYIPGLQLSSSVAVCSRKADRSTTWYRHAWHQCPISGGGEGTYVHQPLPHSQRCLHLSTAQNGMWGWVSNHSIPWHVGVFKGASLCRRGGTSANWNWEGRASSFLHIVYFFRGYFLRLFACVIGQSAGRYIGGCGWF